MKPAVFLLDIALFNLIPIAFLFVLNKILLGQPGRHFRTLAMISTIPNNLVIVGGFLYSTFKLKSFDAIPLWINISYGVLQLVTVFFAWSFAKKIHERLVESKTRRALWAFGYSLILYYSILPAGLWLYFEVMHLKL